MKNPEKMLVQPDHHRGGGGQSQQPRDCPETSVLPDKISASSVKLRRKNRESLADAEKKRNRYSGGDFLLGSPARGHNFRGREATAQPQVPASSYGGQTQSEQSQDRMRKSGDWSYVSFPGRGYQLIRHNVLNFSLFQSSLNFVNLTYQLKVTFFRK